MKLRFIAGARIVPVTAPAPACGIHPASYPKVNGRGWGLSLPEDETMVTRNGPLSRNGGVKTGSLWLNLKYSLATFL